MAAEAWETGWARESVSEQVQVMEQAPAPERRPGSDPMTVPEQDESPAAVGRAEVAPLAGYIRVRSAAAAARQTGR